MKAFKHDGLALIQVLLLTTLISVIAIQISKTARSNVKLAQDFQGRTQAELLLKSAEASVLSELFRLDSHQINGANIKGNKWYLGKAFKLNDYTNVEITPLAGRLSLLTAPELYIKKALLLSGVEEEQLTPVYDSVMDWIDADNSTRRQGAESSSYEGKVKPRNGPLQHVSELASIKGMNESIVRRFSRFVTIYATQAFNPAFATKELNSALFGEDVAENLYTNSVNGKSFNEQDWIKLVGGQVFESIDFNPGTLHQITVKITIGDVFIEQVTLVKVQNQNAVTPFVILSRS